MERSTYRLHIFFGFIGSLEARAGSRKRNQTQQTLFLCLNSFRILIYLSLGERERESAGTIQHDVEQ